MSTLTTKQKIIVAGIIAIMLIVIGIYGYFSLNNSQEEINVTSTEEINKIQNEITNQQEKETEQENNSIVIHIAGEVKSPGVLELIKGARIADAIEKAGGITQEADLTAVNLAYVLEDAQKIYIPNKADALEEKMYITNENGNNVIVDNKNTSKEVNKKVNINEANQSELETLPGIGPSLATRIIEYRKQNGKFAKIEDLQNVKGIGNSKFANIKDGVTV